MAQKQEKQSEVNREKAIKKVLKGKRTLPPYVNEHDCFEDIKSSKNGNKEITYIENREEYGSGLKHHPV